MQHTFLWRAGRWSASGSFVDEDGAELRAEGETLVSHDHDAWRIEATLRLLADNVTELATSYRIEPPAGGAAAQLRWEARNPALGTMRGLLVPVEETMLLAGASEDDRYRVHESVIRLNRGTYRSRGVLLCNGRRLSSWGVTLVRQR